MAHIQFVDGLVREYLVFRGFTSAVKAFDNDLKTDKEKGFRVDKIIEQILHFINISDLNGFKEYWSHLDSLIFSKLEIQVQPAVRKLEYSLYKLYLVTAAQSTGGARNEKLSEFLTKMLPELQGQSEWKDWFMLPYIQKPEDNPTFSVYFTRVWQDIVIVSFHNLLSTVFQCMPQPTLANYGSDALMIKRLQDELSAAKIKAQQSGDKSTGATQSKSSEKLAGPQPLIDDFYAIPPEQIDSAVREARGLRSFIRQMGGSPVLGRKSTRVSNQN